MSVRAPGGAWVLLLAVAACASCTESISPAADAAVAVDLSVPPVDETPDSGGEGLDSLTPAFDPCGDVTNDVSCFDNLQGPPNNAFSLQSDANPNPLVRNENVSRDENGYLRLGVMARHIPYLHVVDGTGGTVARLDIRAVHEVARYPSVTCGSLPTGSTAACDGQTGCCAVDDWARYQARLNKVIEPGHQAVQLDKNSPSRTAVDENGDLYVANRAFGGQSSVTKIAFAASECIDRNNNGKIDTSRDSNGDGVIQTDCNGDGLPDDLAGVAKTPCLNGRPQEYYGLDDECVLWTSNTFDSAAVGRSIGLSTSSKGAPLSDVWAGSYASGSFVRLDSRTGIATADSQLPGECSGDSGPWGMAVDPFGYAWVALHGGGLCYFDTGNPRNVGSVRAPKFGSPQADGIALDRDDNVWLGGATTRYTPDRSNGFKNLGNGWWTAITGSPSIGVAVDQRTDKDYFAWACTGSGVLRIPASTIAVVKNDQQIDPAGWPTINMPCFAVGVDTDQNVWGVGTQTTTRARVAANGAINQPDVNGPAVGKNLCPEGDSCPQDNSYNYSDFTGFPLRNTTPASGSYQLIIPGCRDSQGQAVDTQWFQLAWNAGVPPGTTLVVRARSGSSADPTDPSWASNPFTPVGPSPVDLQQVLSPNLNQSTLGQVVNDGYLLIQIDFTTTTPGATPTLRSFDVGFKCEGL